MWSSNSGRGESFCDAMPTELKWLQEWEVAWQGRGANASCNVTRMRKAYYFYSIPYDDTVCFHFPKRSTHELMLLLVKLPKKYLFYLGSKICFSTRSKTIFSKIYRERETTYTCSTKNLCLLSHLWIGLTKLCNIQKHIKFHCLLLFGTTSKGTIMEIRSTPCHPCHYN